MADQFGLFSLDEFKDLIRQVRTRRTFSVVYKHYPYALDVSPSNEKEVAAAGFRLEVIDASDTQAEIKVRLNESTSSLIRMRLGDSIVTPFYRFFVTWDPQPGQSITLSVSPAHELFRMERGSVSVRNIDAPISIGSVLAPTVLFPWLVERATGAQQNDGRVFERYVERDPPAGDKAFLQVWVPEDVADPDFKVLVSHIGITNESAALAKYLIAHHNTAIGVSSIPLVRTENHGPILPNSELESYSEVRDFTQVSGLATPAITFRTLPVPAGASREIEVYAVLRKQDMGLLVEGEPDVGLRVWFRIVEGWNSPLEVS